MCLIVYDSLIAIGYIWSIYEYEMTEVNVHNNTKHTGKVAVVTDSSKGRSRAIALAFAKSNTYFLNS